ncbi:hypothetical protein O181_072297 [Austropuccinia psidii MF-1]|uniref:Uncharacterized protein n=1 Tax=Austropuccinia psidii MF-1 TaxID=1389203 RepID=A0A9Q3F6W7_9BASI|nr:hypothetical protein [Austropuccinia psidii MF-1]
MRPRLNFQHCLPPEVKIGRTSCGAGCNNAPLRSAWDQPESENGEAKHLNHTLGDMARAMLTKSGPVWTAPLNCYIISIWGKGHCACSGGPTVTQAGRKGHLVPTSQTATGLWRLAPLGSGE